jgi:phenylalanine-4-hydroxylase
VTESFETMKDQVITFAEKHIDRPFVCRYNALTQSIELLDTKEKISRTAKLLKNELSRLSSALEKL